MAQSKHTPGPWSAVNNPSSNYGLGIVADVKVKAKRVVCRVSGPDRDANARLIAAAPELLVAAKLALSEAESWIHDQLDGTSALDLALARLTPARAAVAKAEGGVS